MYNLVVSDYRVVGAQLTGITCSKMLETKKRAELHSYLSAALALPPSPPAPGTAPGKLPHQPLTASASASATSHPYFTEGAALFKHCRSLLQTYETLSNSIAQAVPDDIRDVEQRWRSDAARVERLLFLGRRVAERSIEKVLLRSEEVGKDVEKAVTRGDGRGGGGEEIGAEEQEMREASVFFRSSVERGERRGEGVSLVDTLRLAERGVRRLAKGLPVEED